MPKEVPQLPPAWQKLMEVKPDADGEYPGQVLSGTEFLCGGVKCRLLGVRESADPAIRAKAKAFLQDELKDNVKSMYSCYGGNAPWSTGQSVEWWQVHDKTIPLAADTIVVPQKHKDPIQGRTVTVYYNTKPAVDADGTPLVWLGWVNAKLIEERLAEPELKPDGYTFFQHGRGGVCPSGWQHEIWEVADPATRGAEPVYRSPYDSLIPSSSEITERLKKIWTVARIREYCRPETLEYAIRQAMIPGPIAPRAGQLYTEAETGGFSVNWRAGAYIDVGHSLSLWASNGHRSWKLANDGTLDLLAGTLDDDQVVQRRLCDSLESCLEFYEHSYLLDFKTGDTVVGWYWPDWNHRELFWAFFTYEKEKLTRDAEGRACEYEAKVRICDYDSSRRTSCHLKIVLGKEGNPAAFFINGKEDGKLMQIWNNFIHSHLPARLLENGELREKTYPGTEDYICCLVPTDDIGCLATLGRKCREYAKKHGKSFPPGWTSLDGYDEDLELYVLYPQSLNLNGVGVSVPMHWMQVIQYLPGRTLTSDPEAVLAYISPEFYAGRCALVLRVCGRVDFLTPCQFMELVRRPAL